MVTVIDSVDIKGLRKVHFEQMLTYLEEREREGWYYGPRRHFEIRHDDIKLWLQNVINLLGGDGVIVPKHKVKNLLTTKEEVAKVRESLEDKTREAFDEFVKNRTLPSNIIYDKVKEV